MFCTFPTAKAPFSQHSICGGIVALHSVPHNVHICSTSQTRGDGPDFSLWQTLTFCCIFRTDISGTLWANETIRRTSFVPKLPAQKQWPFALAFPNFSLFSPHTKPSLFFLASVSACLWLQCIFLFCFLSVLLEFSDQIELDVFQSVYFFDLALAKVFSQAQRQETCKCEDHGHWRRRLGTCDRAQAMHGISVDQQVSSLKRLLSV